jgi:hypothetical protein
VPQPVLLTRREGRPQRLLRVVTDEGEPAKLDPELAGPDVLLDDVRERIRRPARAERTLQVGDAPAIPLPRPE